MSTTINDFIIEKMLNLNKIKMLIQIKVWTVKLKTTVKTCNYMIMRIRIRLRTDAKTKGKFKTLKTYTNKTGAEKTLKPMFVCVVCTLHANYKGRI